MEFNLLFSFPYNQIFKQIRNKNNFSPDARVVDFAVLVTDTPVKLQFLERLQIFG